MVFFLCCIENKRKFFFVEIRDSNRTENYLQGNSPFEVQKRDTEGPADADNFAMHRPESVRNCYLE